MCGISFLVCRSCGMEQPMKKSKNKCTVDLYLFISSVRLVYL